MVFEPGTMTTISAPRKSGMVHGMAGSAVALPGTALYSLALSTVGLTDYGFPPRSHYAAAGARCEPRVIPSTNRTPQVSGKDRNKLCGCGCGRKKKHCPNGAKEIIPPVHTLTEDEYVARVEAILNISHGLGITSIIMRTCTESHIRSYCRDGVITPERCAELCYRMYRYDHELTINKDTHGDESC